MPKTVVGLFESDDANRAVEALVNGGWSRDEIDLIGSQRKEESEKTGRVGWFFEEHREEAELYSEALRRGQAVVAVNTPDDRAESAADIMLKFNPVEIHAEAAKWREKGWRGAGQKGEKVGEEITIPVTEEKVKIGKRVVERGGVRVYSRVSERPVSEDVTLHEEKVHVERQPVDRPATAADRPFEERTAEFTETAEESVVSKTAKVVEEVKVSKEEEEHEEHIEETERRTEVEVQPIPGQSRPERHPRP